MRKFSITQTTKRFWIVVSILIVGILGIFFSTAPTPVQAYSAYNTNMTYINGKDIVGASLPLAVTNNATSSENTWGRVIRVTGKNAAIVPPNNINSYFDIGVDDAGNFFINSPTDTKTSHSLIISPTGHVTIRP
jgi:hypothetical protein